MRNPVSSLPMFNPSVPEGTFRRGFFRGLGSGALMMGIFSTIYAVAAMIPGSPVQFHLITSLITMGLGTLSTGLFSGIMATQRSASEVSTASRDSHEAPRREPARAPEHALAPTMASAVDDQRQWTERVGSGRSNRLSEILADRSLDDSGRAAAILREREQSSLLEASR